MYKHQENWILFRTTQELLKREKTLYLNDADDYFGLTDEQKKRQLIQRVEDLISVETSKYFAFHKPNHQQESQKIPASSGSSSTTT
jgi:predicted component of type VI protein secretion system